MIEIPGVGTFHRSERDGGWWRSDTTYDVPGLGVRAALLVDDPETDPAATAETIRRLLALPAGFRDTLTPFLRAYRADVAAETGAAPPLGGPDEVWSQVRIGDELVVQQHQGRWYVDVESGCDWEPEHGLQVVLRDGDTLVKVGPYDGHLTHDWTDEVYPGAGHADGRPAPRG